MLLALAIVALVLTIVGGCLAVLDRISRGVADSVSEADERTAPREVAEATF